jgi:CelD/BcsL family acetyltransferase involved in cellulose biosynthesis
MRKLQSRGKVRLTCSTRADATLQQFYDLEQAGWKGRARTAILHDRPAHQYYDALATAASRCGYFSLYTLECGEQAVAMQYGLTHAGRYFVLKTAYDETLRECSPGHLVTLEILQELACRGCVEFDFLGLPMGWKRDWAPRLRPHANWYVFRGALGSVLHLLNARARRFAGRTMRRRRVSGTRPAQTGSAER